MTAVPEVGVKPDAQDYVKIFSELCAWDPPDPRFYPPVREAAELHDWQRRIVVDARFRGPIGITYARGSFPQWPSA